MEKKRVPWWVYMLTAAIAVACVLAATWIMLHRERLDGLDVMLILAWWAVAVAWTVRAVRTFPGRRKNDTETTNGNIIINGGDNHE